MPLSRLLTCLLSTLRFGRGRVALPLAACLFLVTAGGSFAWAEDPPAKGTTAEDVTVGAVDFQRQVKPILSQRCFACHGPDPDHREAGLRLDTAEGATEDLGGYAAVVPGNPETSELMRRITADDDAVMPPPEVGDRLSEAEVGILRRWIAQGGRYEQHWSYQPPTRVRPPEVTEVAWPDDPIDRYVLAVLEAEGLKPSAAADRYALIRRLSLDLVGLPPTPEQADAFVADRRPDAYRRLVDSLLADPAFAERWAAVWLDLARYADSAGYADDPPRTIWAYRDYVIRAFAENISFDRFTLQQIAGDLLDEPSEEALIATAFHRNTMTNSEGGTDDEEFRSAAVVDRVNTTMAVWMGTTMACAQCHTHKYDPITQEEYFRFYAFFNNTADADLRDESPTLPVYDPQQQARRAALQQQLQKLQDELAGDGWTISADQLAWEQRIAASQPAVPTARFVRVDLPGQTQFLSLAEVQVYSQGENVALQGAATQSSTAFEGPAAKAIDGNTDGRFEVSRSVTHTASDKNPWWEVDLGQPQPIESVVVWNRTDGNVHTRLNGFRVSLLDAQRKVVFRKRFKQAAPAEQSIAVNAMPADIVAIAAIDHSLRSDAQRRQIGQFYVQQQIDALQQALDEIKPATAVPVMRELTENRRETLVQIRGNYLDTAERVAPGVPEAFHPLPESATPDRLALARWLIAPQNPLTARVIANRVWEQLFGTGLVTTSEEFGSQGEVPSHPHLLDALALQLTDSGWDFKELVRRIVCSATYQQSATVTAESAQRDPANRLLARGPRFRISAEMVRDQALAVSGLLSYKMFGPPVHPPRPVLNLKAAFGGSTDWKDSSGEDRYRRGLYTEWRRSMPYPSMSTFDMPSREVCTLNRGRTNTPLQALITLNDPVYVEAAQGLARRTLREPSAQGDAERVRWVLRRCLIRPPHDDEVDAMLRLLDKARTWYADHPDEAVRMATEPIGPVPRDLKQVTVGELAAWTVAGNVLLNLDEVLQK